MLHYVSSVVTLKVRLALRHTVPQNHNNRCDPTIQCCVGLYIGVIQHSLDENGIHLNHEIMDANKVNMERMEHPKQTVQLQLSL